MAEAGAGKCGDQEPGDSPQSAVSCGVGHCKWFNVRMGFGFLAMTSREGASLEPPVDVFVHQSKLHMDGFRSLKEGEPVEFTFKKSSKGLESLRVTGPGGSSCVGSERRPKGKNVQKRRPKGDRCYNCGGLDHHAKECKMPPQPKKCHYCQSITHMVANCSVKAAQLQPAGSAQGRPDSKPPASPQPTASHSPSPTLEEETEQHSEAPSPECSETPQQEASSAAVAEEQSRRGSGEQRQET
ncbi:protein lin-28 homolog A [Callorhinchus milii]|nr:protein lin-28 homolog A [Callorhinchus milii]